MLIRLGILVSLFIGGNVHAQEVTVFFKMRPAGDFQAESKALEGKAVSKAGTISAKDVKLKLDTLTTKNGLRDSHMKDKYLETKKFPIAEVVKADGKAGQGKATLRIHGVEKEVSGTYELANGGKTLKGKFPISLSEFGITGVSYSGIGVKDAAEVNFSLPVVNE